MMESDASRLALLMGASVMVNTVSAVQRGKDPILPVVAGGVTFVGLALFGGITNRYGLSNAIAGVFLLASFVFRGLPLIQKGNLLGTTGGGKGAPASASGNPSGSTANSTADGNSTPSDRGVGM